MRNKVVIVSVLMCGLTTDLGALAQKRAAATTAAPAKPVAARSIIVVTEPRAAVWLNDLRRGTTGDDGRLTIEKTSAGAQKLRVRKTGFAEKTVNLTPVQRGEVAVDLTETTDAAEIWFQTAEFAAETGREAERRRAVELYRKALQTNPKHLQAQIGLARALNDLNDQDAALEAVAAARKINPRVAEASTVEGRIYRKLEDYDSAVKSFRRAVREAANVSPEAHTGLALALNDAGDHENAVKEFKIALAQLAGTEPVIYQYLGETYEKMNRFKDSIAAYEEFLKLAPTSSDASAVRSIIERLKKRANGDTLELMPQ